jgi:hypothetical protein
MKNKRTEKSEVDDLRVSHFTSLEDVDLSNGENPSGICGIHRAKAAPQPGCVYPSEEGRHDLLDYPRKSALVSSCENLPVQIMSSCRSTSIYSSRRSEAHFTAAKQRKLRSLGLKKRLLTYGPLNQ